MYSITGITIEKAETEVHEPPGKREPDQFDPLSLTKTTIGIQMHSPLPICQKASHAVKRISYSNTT
jgi:hypothetical protein